MKKVTDSYGREVYIDDDKRKLYSYSNKEKKSNMECLKYMKLVSYL